MPKKSPTSSSNCRLCGAPGPLIVSHVIPDFFIRSLERNILTGKSGQKQPTSIMMSLQPGEPEGPRQRGYWEKRSGIKEPMLCRACEGRFSRYENYFRVFFYGNTPPPLKKLSIGTPLTIPPSVGLDPDIVGVSHVKLDYTQFKLFVLSLLWRASVAKGDFFEKVALGPHESKIAAMLKAETPGPDNEYSVLMIDLQHGKYGIEDFVQQPDCVRDGAQRAYSFVLGGFMLVVFVSATGHLSPEPVRSFCLQTSGDLVLVSSRADHIFRWWGTRLKQAGKL